ncbi:MAG: hypothetical protein PHE55_11015 [Methylococcaceae bacterium]|nr:hypothetical protein [Methylococcaceae bacterium]
MEEQFQRLGRLSPPLEEQFQRLGRHSPSLEEHYQRLRKLGRRRGAIQSDAAQGKGEGIDQ